MCWPGRHRACRPDQEVHWKGKQEQRRDRFEMGWMQTQRREGREEREEKQMKIRKKKGYNSNWVRRKRNELTCRCVVNHYLSPLLEGFTQHPTSPCDSLFNDLSKIHILTLDPDQPTHTISTIRFPLPLRYFAACKCDGGCFVSPCHLRFSCIFPFESHHDPSMNILLP